MRAQLIPLDGGAPIELVKDLTLVGRKDECDLRLENKSVSKMHCVLVKTDGLLLLRDLGSTNGTRVNGQRVRRVALLPNDHLAIASCKFRIYVGMGEPPIGEHEHTQHLNANDVGEMVRAAQPAPAEAVPQPVKPRPLPDLYPNEESMG